MATLREIEPSNWPLDRIEPQSPRTFQTCLWIYEIFACNNAVITTEGQIKELQNHEKIYRSEKMDHFIH